MIQTSEILDTLRMIDREKLDVRTITMGISLFPCVSDDVGVLCRRVYDRITRKAEHLVAVGEAIEREFGVPIVNKRISVTPAALICGGVGDPVPLARALDDAAKTTGVDFIGGYSALVQKGMTDADRRLIESIPEALSTTGFLCSSVNVASTRAGIDMDAVALLGKAIKKTAELTSDNDGLGCAKFVAFANAVEDNPFMAGAFHGPGEGDAAISVGVSGPGVVKSALEDVQGEPFDVVAETVKRTAFRITRIGAIGGPRSLAAAGRALWHRRPLPRPHPGRGRLCGGDPRGDGPEVCGTHGTTAALALLNDAVKKGGVMASSHVGGLSGAFIPVSEDIGMIRAAEKGALTLDKLEAMTCVCSVGLDMIAVPGDTSAETISAIIADEAAIGVINNKTTAVRIIPAPGKKVGDSVEFGGLLGRAR